MPLPESQVGVEAPGSQEPGMVLNVPSISTGALLYLECMAALSVQPAARVKAAPEAAFLATSTLLICVAFWSP